MEEFLRSLGIDGDFNTAEDGCVFLDIPDSDEYGRLFSKLDRSDKLECDEDSSLVTYESSSIQYINDEYTITLLADMGADIYKLTCRKN